MPSSEKICFGAPMAQLESLSQGRQKQENTTPSLHWHPRLNSKSKVGGGGSLWFGKIFGGHRPGSVTFPSSQVRFSRPESEQARQRRVQSYEFLQKKHAEEPWVHLHYYGMRDSRSEHERQYLLCQGSSGVENTELVKSPRWDWLVLATGSGKISVGTMAPFPCRQGEGGTLLLLLGKSQEGGLA